MLFRLDEDSCRSFLVNQLHDSPTRHGSMVLFGHNCPRTYSIISTDLYILCVGAESKNITPQTIRTPLCLVLVSTNLSAHVAFAPSYYSRNIDLTQSKLIHLREQMYDLQPLDSVLM